MFAKLIEVGQRAGRIWFVGRALVSVPAISGGADTYTVKTDLANAITFELQRQTIPVARAKLRFAQFGQDGTIEAGTDRLRFIKIPDLGAATPAVPGVSDVDAGLLSETANPQIEPLPTLTYVEVTTLEIGRGVGISRRARNVSPIDLVSFARDTLGFDAARRIDTRIREELMNGGVAVYGGVAASRAAIATTDVLKFGDARKWLIKLMAADLDDAVDLVAVTHPFVVGDIMGDATANTGWVQANQYAGSTRLFTGEVGSAYGIRFVTTTRSKVLTGAGAGGIDVYVSFVGLGPWAFGKARIEDLRFQVVPNTPDHYDWLGRQWILSYYMDFGVKVLDANRYLRVESAATVV